MSVVAAGALSKEQQSVVVNTSDSILLLAGAGTGKTTTLARRVAYLLESGAARPEEILCLTFTNRACREMSERIAQIAGETAQEVLIRTVHSFCVWLLRQIPPDDTDLRHDFAVCDQSDGLEIIREVVFQVTGREIEEFPASILQNFIGLVKDCWLEHPEGGRAGACTFAFLHRKAEIERICIDRQYRFDGKFFHFLAKYGASIVRLYDEKLLSNNLLDFSDLLLRANAALSDPQLTGLWKGRYKFVHVDEVQDVSLAEYGLIVKLCAGAKLLFCGDFNQTIYQWRGSNPEALTVRFRSDFHPVTVEFVENYRSSPGLLAASRNFLCNAFDAPVTGSPAGDDLVIREFDTMPEEVSWIYRTIEELPVTDYSRVAIITRNNRACMEVCGLLKACRLSARKPIRFMLADEFRLFKRPEIKDAIACLNLLANPQDSESLKRVLTRLAKGVGTGTINAILSLYQSGLGVALTDFVDARTNTGDYFGALLDALDSGHVVVFDVESTGTDVFTDDIVQMAAARIDANGNVLARFERFLKPSRPVGNSEKVHGFSDVFLAENGIEPVQAFAEFLDFAGTDVIVGHNVAFDMTITAQNLRKYNTNRKFDNLYYDTLDISRRFLKKLENHKLSTVAAALDAANDPSHNAMDDIMATADVLVALTDRFVRPKTEERGNCYQKFLAKFTHTASILSGLAADMDAMDAPQLASQLSDAFGLREKYAEESERLSNLLLFEDFISDFADRGKPVRQQLSDILELTALSASELDRMTASTNQVAVITAHQAKGCEFDYVFLPVLQEGVFPSYQAVRDSNVEEEKRVFYVSITRAKRKLYLSWSHYTLNAYSAKPSRFLPMLEQETPRRP